MCIIYIPSGPSSDPPREGRGSGGVGEGEGGVEEPRGGAHCPAAGEGGSAPPPEGGARVLPQGGPGEKTRSCFDG